MDASQKLNKSCLNFDRYGEKYINYEELKPGLLTRGTSYVLVLKHHMSSDRNWKYFRSSVLRLAIFSNYKRHDNTGKTLNHRIAEHLSLTRSYHPAERSSLARSHLLWPCHKNLLFPTKYTTSYNVTYASVASSCNTRYYLTLPILEPAIGWKIFPRNQEKQKKVNSLESLYQVIITSTLIAGGHFTQLTW